MMTHLTDEEADKMSKLSDKLDKVLSGNQTQVALAALNFSTLKVILSNEAGLIMSQALAAAFLSNLMNSIHAYHGEDAEEQMH